MGEHPTPGFTSRACIWHNGVIWIWGLPLVTYATTADAINNLGDACGFAIWPCSQCKVPIRRPCAWIDGQFIDLGAFAGLVGGLALDINDAGEIVGYCTNETGSNIAPFLWRGGVMRDLNDLVPAGSAVVSLPLAINNRGQIAGWGIGADNGVAFRITPALPQHAGDTNCDSAVNVNDLLDVINHWNPAGPVGGDPADLNRDNTINAFDLMEVIFHWGQ